MADLVIKCQCKSWLRQYVDVFLNVTFPVWGLLLPIMVVIGAGNYLNNLQLGVQPSLLYFLAPMVLAICYCLGSLLLKRALGNDLLVVNRQGITLPFLVGGRLGWKTNLPWSEVRTIDASIVGEAPQKSRLTFVRQNGKRQSIPVKDLESDFVEQLVLAAKMWAPEKCATNLDELQNVLRIGARETAMPSYTDLWEDELSRRFCPTQYVPLEPGRVLRNNSLKVVRQLATGGLSALYLCHLDCHRLVVLKEATIPQQGSDELKEKAREMFDREAKLLLKVDHPGIVHVLDCFTELGRNYMILPNICKRPGSLATGQAKRSPIRSQCARMGNTNCPDSQNSARARTAYHPPQT